MITADNINSLSIASTPEALYSAAKSTFTPESPPFGNSKFSTAMAAFHAGDFASCQAIFAQLCIQTQDNPITHGICGGLAVLSMILVSPDKAGPDWFHTAKSVLMAGVTAFYVTSTLGLDPASLTKRPPSVSEVLDNPDSSTDEIVTAIKNRLERIPVSSALAAAEAITENELDRAAGILTNASLKVGAASAEEAARDNRHYDPSTDEIVKAMRAAAVFLAAVHCGENIAPYRAKLTAAFSCGS